jgi:predicted DCC family thiol-disulfide oxidoreductase YuxK
MENLPKDKKIILFDGVCNLCNSAVLFIIKQDSKDLFRFVALQSELEKKIINHIGIDSQNGQYYSI